MLNSDTQEYIPRNLRQQYPSSHFKEADILRNLSQF